MIDCPDHCDIEELLVTLVFYCKWKDEAGDNIHKYITW